jgi:hypothetical protein
LNYLRSILINSHQDIFEYLFFEGLKEVLEFFLTLTPTLSRKEREKEKSPSPLYQGENLLSPLDKGG